MDNSAEKLKVAAQHHIESFNYFYTHGLTQICKHLSPIEVCKPGHREIVLPFKSMKIWIEELQVGPPNQSGQGDTRLFPTQCRQSKKSYTAPILGTICRQIDDRPKETIRMSLGDIPIVVKSAKCHLANLSEAELIEN